MNARIGISVALAAVLLAAKMSGTNAQGKRLTADQQQIVDTVSTIFTAARADDVETFDSVVARGFYLYDDGARFDGDAVMAVIKRLHVAGKRYEWHVTEPDVHIGDDTAWITFVNQGSISDASGTTDQTRLESAFLEKQARAWKIVFLHSTRVPSASLRRPATSFDSRLAASFNL